MARGTQLWFNGKILPVENAKISLYTHGLHYGMGIFEGIRVYKQKSGGGAVFRLKAHMQRFLESANILGLNLGYSLDELCDASVEVCKKNGFEECYLRPIAFIGDGPLGIYIGEKPPIDVAILTWEWGKYLGDKGVEKGARLKISSFNRPHPNSIMTKGKITGQYATGVLAKVEAVKMGFDEALLLDAEGYLTEGTGENIFIVKNGVIKTTPPNSILAGITRQTIIDLLRRKGHEVVEQRFTRDELWCADEVFLTGTAAEITPVSEIDMKTIGQGPLAGMPGVISKTLQKDYDDLVRGVLKPEFASDWLTPV